MTNDGMLLAFFPEVIQQREEAARQRAELAEQQRLALEAAQAQALEEKLALWDAAQDMAAVAPSQPAPAPVRTQAEVRARMEQIRHEYETTMRRRVFG